MEIPTYPGQRSNLTPLEGHALVEVAVLDVDWNGTRVGRYEHYEMERNENDDTYIYPVTIPRISLTADGLVEVNSIKEQVQFVALIENCRIRATVNYYDSSVNPTTITIVNSHMTCDAPSVAMHNSERRLVDIMNRSILNKFKADFERSFEGKFSQFVEKDASILSFI